VLLLALVTAAVSLGLGNPAQAATAGQLSLPTVVTRVTVAVDGRSFPARLVQPTGANPGAYPVVAFGHGFAQTSSRYASTLSALAARGYVVIAPDSETGLFPSHGRFADDLERSIRWVRAAVPNAHRTLDAVAGHSMGGGAALVAADRYPGIDAVATLAAAETRPSATTASAGISAPALYVVGDRDTIVRPATTRAMYDRKPSPARFVTITGGYHCGFTDSTSFFGLGCDSGAISRSAQLAITREVLGDWLDAALLRRSVVSSPAGIGVLVK
jgi:pimeloyl-ACP methyl ester carboxylesterase